MKIGLSNVHHVPVWKFDDRATFSLWNYRDAKIYEDVLRWERQGSIDHVSIKGIELSYAKAKCLLSEWCVWRKYYLPPFSLNDKIVLDVGAGSGETAYFYLKHGANKVICIENGAQHPEDLECLYINKKKLNIEIYPESFKLEHLQLPHDFLKIDIDGGEEIMLDYDLSKLKPCIIEVESNELTDKFIAKGFHIVRWLNKDLGLSIVGKW